MATIINGSTGASQIQDNTVSNAKVVDDAVGIAELSATGTASSSTFLRGDNAWAAPGGGGLTQLASAATTSGTSIVFSGLNLSTYKFLYICQNGVGWAADTAGIQRLTPNGGSFVRWAGGGSAVPGYYGLTFVDLSTGIGSGTTVSATPAAIIHAGGAFTTFVNTGISASTTSLTFGTDGNVAQPTPF